MCISKFFALFRKAKAQPTPTKSEYNPKCAYIRVDNLACSAKLTMREVNEAMQCLRIESFHLLTGQRGRFVTNKDAHIIYNYLRIKYRGN